MNENSEIGQKLKVVYKLKPFASVKIFLTNCPQIAMFTLPKK